jgi:hypothetical protein
VHLVVYLYTRISRHNPIKSSYSVCVTPVALFITHQLLN